MKNKKETYYVPFQEGEDTDLASTVSRGIWFRDKKDAVTYAKKCNQHKDYYDPVEGILEVTVTVKGRFK